MTTISLDQRCPCGTGEPYGLCCERFHSGRAQPPTAESLMRSRFTAFALGLPEYLLKTWHPSTRPASLGLDETIRWQRLEILETLGGPFDDVARVSFEAHYRTVPGGSPSGTGGVQSRGVQREDSRFVREHGTWFYVDDDDG